MGRKIVALGMLVLAFAGVPAMAATATTNHRQPRRQSQSTLPDLTISSGALTAAKGKIHGSFMVKNVGDQRAKKSLAVVEVAAGSKPSVVQIYAVRALAPGGTEMEAVSESVPSGLPDGRFPIRACADYHHTVAEQSRSNDCRRVGTVTVSSGTPGSGSTVPGQPANLSPDTPTFFPDGLGQYDNTPGADFTSGYWAEVPKSYDATNQTPITLLVWLHGCDGQAKYDISDVSTGVSATRRYIAIAPSGPEAGGGSGPGCWNPNSDVPKVLTDIAQAETHFNINRRRVIIAGYSSGGDLAYRTIFYNADKFAGILAINTDPFRDTGSTEQQSLAAAAWKFNIVHIAHQNDDTYPVSQVTPHINDLKAAGFPVDYLIRPGHHYDNDSCPPGQTGPNCIGTTYDMQHYLLPHVDSDGWLAPAP